MGDKSVQGVCGALHCHCRGKSTSGCHWYTWFRKFWRLGLRNEDGLMKMRKSRLLTSGKILIASWSKSWPNLCVYAWLVRVTLLSCICTSCQNKWSLSEGIISAKRHLFSWNNLAVISFLKKSFAVFIRVFDKAGSHVDLCGFCWMTLLGWMEGTTIYNYFAAQWPVSDPLNCILGQANPSSNFPEETLWSCGTATECQLNIITEFRSISWLLLQKEERDSDCVLFFVLNASLLLPLSTLLIGVSLLFQYFCISGRMTIQLILSRQHHLFCVATISILNSPGFKKIWY